MERRFVIRQAIDEGIMRKVSALRMIVLSFSLTMLLSACRVPLRVGGSSGVKISNRIAAGGNHTCRLEDGAVQCQGENQQGQLGDGTFDDRTAPVKVVGFSGGAASVAAG